MSGLAAMTGTTALGLLSNDLRRLGVPLAEISTDPLAEITYEPQTEGYIAGYRGFFGPPVYGARTFYPHIIRWRFDDGRRYSVRIDPKIDRRHGDPVEDQMWALEQVRDFVLKSANARH